MSFSIDGWVDVTISCSEEQADPVIGKYAWRGVINISPLVDVGDSVSERLFGLSKASVLKESQTVPFFSARGMPPFPSPQVQAATTWPGGTWATWDEINLTLAELATELRDSDWRLVFDLVRRVVDDYRFADDRVRIVVWYEW